MSTTSKRVPEPDATDMRDEYEFNYARAKSNRFAAGMAKPVVAVVLEPDVASVFSSAARVNRELRSIITARATKTKASRPRNQRRKAG